MFQVEFAFNHSGFQRDLFVDDRDVSIFHKIVRCITDINRDELLSLMRWLIMQHTELARLLDAKDSLGSTPVMVAKRLGDFKTAAWLRLYSQLGAPSQSSGTNQTSLRAPQLRQRRQS
jgi:hypothetical protein